MEVVKDYDVRLDSKKRVTLRGAKYPYYNVKECDNGCILLEPRELTVPKSISSKTLKSMDEAIRNFKIGKVSEPVDLSDEARRQAEAHEGKSFNNTDELMQDLLDA